MSGTSFAAAYVSGLAAILCGIASDGNRDEKINAEVRTAIEVAATNMAGSNSKLIDVASSIAYLLKIN
jgi:hypothetical protein